MGFHRLDESDEEIEGGDDWHEGLVAFRIATFTSRGMDRKQQQELGGATGEASLRSGDFSLHDHMGTDFDFHRHHKQKSTMLTTCFVVCVVFNSLSGRWGPASTRQTPNTGTRFTGRLSSLVPTSIITTKACTPSSLRRAIAKNTHMHTYTSIFVHDF